MNPLDNLTDAQIIEETFREAFMAVMAATDPCPDCPGCGTCPACGGDGRHEDDHDADGNCSACEGSGSCSACAGLGMVVPRSGVPTEARDALSRAWEAAGGKDQVVS